jgi:hypothetical protein
VQQLLEVGDDRPLHVHATHPRDGVSHGVARGREPLWGGGTRR